MHIIEAAILTNAGGRRSREAEQAYFERASRYAPALRRAVALVATVAIVVIALQVASAGAVFDRDGVELASISINH